MTEKEREPFTQWASVFRTDRFISFEPLSGYIRCLRESVNYRIYLKPDVDDEALGRGLLEALDKSRFIWPPDEPDFFEAQRIEQCYRNWEKEFMQRYGYKTKRDAYKTMNWCRAQRSEGKIAIRPHPRRSKPGEWLWLPPEEDVVIPETRDTAVVAAALRLALERCE
jgi:hypothetical protein